MVDQDMWRSVVDRVNRYSDLPSPCKGPIEKNNKMRRQKKKKKQIIVL